MRSLYVRPHRGSIYEPATIHDIPQEVLEDSLILLLPSIEDLVAASLACRAWKPVAQKLIHSRVTINYGDHRRVEDMVCGYILNSLVFGSSSFQISTLSLQLDYIGKEYIPKIAQIVASTLSSLNLDFNGDEDFSVCYKTLEIFFLQCQWIRNLRLEKFEFGDQSSSASSTIKEGFSRLNLLDLINCYGNSRLFIESTPIANLKSFRYESYDTSSDEDIECIDAAVTNYGRTLINLNLSGCSVSSGNLVKIAECCRELEKLTPSGAEDNDVLSLYDIKIIASLPILKYLELRYCGVSVEAVAALSRCKSINHLSIRWRDGMSDVLRVIGRNLVSLFLCDEMNVEEIDGVVEFCPNLQYLEVSKGGMILAARVEEVKDTLKDGLKRLAKLKVNGACVRLGTDWKGY
jgi:hypothetical protein